jgi:alkylation response protein AidB-like acyl-CoA dehydrogenase
MSPAPVALDPISRTLSDARKVADGLARPALDAGELETVNAVNQAIRSWCAAEVNVAKIDKEHCIPERNYRTAGELGLFGLTTPEKFGGAGLSLLGSTAVVAEMANFDGSLATAIGLHNGLGLRGLIRYGTPALQERFLPDLASGAKIAAFAATEPNAGSHIAGVRTTGTWDGKDSLSVSGEKCYVTNGGIADVVTILASTPGLGGARKGHSVLLLETDLPGLSVGREEDKLGMRGTSTTSLVFDNVKLGVDHVLGESGKGLDTLAQILSWGRTLMSAGCVGTAYSAFRRTAEYVMTRVQFGKPIGTFGQVREKVAQMRARLFTAESVMRLTALLHAIHESDIVFESSISKIVTSEAVFFITDDAIQLHGGAGYIEETGVCRLSRDCRVTRIFEGANELLRFHVAASALGYTATLGSAPALFGKVDAALDDAAKRFDGLRSRVADVFATIRTRYGVRVGDHQVVLARAADAAIAVFSLMAVLLRTDGELRALTGAEERDQALRVAKFATQMLVQEAEAALAATGTREADEQLILALSEYEYRRADKR